MSLPVLLGPGIPLSGASLLFFQRPAILAFLSQQSPNADDKGFLENEAYALDPNKFLLHRSKSFASTSLAKQK